MKVIIAGSRSITDYNILCEAVKNSKFEISKVISGKCRSGGDALGERWAKENNIEVIPFPADWKNLSHPDTVIRYNRYGKPYDAKAGHRRNEEMAKAADALILLWDGISKGSKNMLENAEKYNLQIYVKRINK